MLLPLTDVMGAVILRSHSMSCLICEGLFQPTFWAPALGTGHIKMNVQCASIDEWIKVWYVCTMEYYSAIKRSEIGPFVETWVDLESLIQNKVSQKEKNKHHTLTYTESREVVLMNLSAGQEERHGHREGAVDTVGEGEEGTNWGNGIGICTVPHVN